MFATGLATFLLTTSGFRRGGVRGETLSANFVYLRSPVAGISPLRLIPAQNRRIGRTLMQAVMDTQTHSEALHPRLVQ